MLAGKRSTWNWEDPDEKRTFSLKAPLPPELPTDLPPSDLQSCLAGRPATCQFPLLLSAPRPVNKETPAGAPGRGPRGRSSQSGSHGGSEPASRLQSPDTSKWNPSRHVHARATPTLRKPGLHLQARGLGLRT